MQNTIAFLKKIRRRHSLPHKFNSQYAFIGVGNHSLTNLYPVINYLHVPLKYIVVKSKETAAAINNSNFGTQATIDIDAVLNDNDINGIFICANPNAHYCLVKKCLSHKKHVFVEKPPCKTIEELNDLISTEKESGKKCLVGLQKRYSSCVSILKKQANINNIISYNYRYTLGAYPEGNILWDLYIHPLDLITFMFGEMELIAVTETKSAKSSSTLFLQAKHGRIIGSIEVSTQYSWNHASEHLSINTENGLYTLTDHQVLTYEPKSGTILSVPKEKIFHSTPEKHYLFNGHNFLPVFNNQTLVSQGYFSEIKTFTNLCENIKSKNISTLYSLLNTYNLITKIEQLCTVSKTM
jgi:virulence factor